MGDGRPTCMSTYFGFRGYGDSHGDSNGDSCGYGMGMGIEIPSPRQPCRALQACTVDTPLADWRRRPGRPRQPWLRTAETDLRPLNLGLATAKRRTQDRAAWRRLVATTTSTVTGS